MAMESLFCDWEANRGNLKGRVVMVLFRLAQWVRSWPAPWWLLGLPVLAFYEVFVEWFLGVELRYKTRVGAGLRLFHGHALVVHEATVIGRNCTLRQSTTIGNKTPAGECPVLCDGVDVGANAVLLGKITIGERAVIGAGSVVVKDVAPGAVVAGNPARVIGVAE
jgi:putative colanic acid biosynthesis acetyltransferase WcaB